jgi:hypothetical protein
MNLTLERPVEAWMAFFGLAFMGLKMRNRRRSSG